MFGPAFAWRKDGSGKTARGSILSSTPVGGDVIVAPSISLMLMLMLILILIFTFPCSSHYPPPLRRYQPTLALLYCTKSSSSEGAEEIHV